ncbi:adenylyl-sulfate kinase [Neomegalonema sp.]|uniref:adenylyl-sulfate kinase n=1 Tax=Neomegalonema sp. TaxID=2039713 RepID=UPI0026267763|nr:adenylyl-sulfate kinase [Neomegalonema sp.]MDD2868482.1 adenylyl-sulfate kinase [Neomegalonema sp.]
MSEAFSSEAEKASRRENATMKGSPAAVFWLTGPPASGKTTLARALAARLGGLGLAVAILDGDDLRRGPCRDLGFSEADRLENMRRAAEAALTLSDCGVIAILALVSPLAEGRRLARARLAGRPFFEIHLDAPLEIRRARDPKGLYAQAARGEIHGLTGYDAPYEPPEAPELRLDSAALGLAESVEAALNLCAPLSAARPPAGSRRNPA